MGKIRFLIVSLLCLFAIPFICDSETNVKADDGIIYNDENGIPDKQLYQEILTVLHKDANATFSKEEAKNVRLIYLNFSQINDIKSLKGISNLVNLEILQIWKCSLSDLSELDKLNNLRELSIIGCNNCNYTSFSKLDKIRSLSLLECGITDEVASQVLANTSELTALDLSNNNLKDVSYISTLTKLERLNLSKNNIETIFDFREFKNLSELHLAHNQLSSVSGLEKITSLEVIDINSNRFTEIPNLKRLKKLSLEYCAFNNNMISEECFLNNLPKHMTQKKWYINCVSILQNVKWQLKLRNTKIKSTTSCISGKTRANAVVKVVNAKGKVLKKAKADNAGKFTIKGLNLKKYNGKKIMLKVYMFYDGRINGDSWYQLLKERTLTVR